VVKFEEAPVESVEDKVSGENIGHFNIEYFWEGKMYKVK